MPRPRNVGIFDLMQYRFPVMAIASIFHRITGVLLLIYVPFILYYLHLSLSGSSGFFLVKSCLNKPGEKFFLWLFLSAVIYHLLAGLKHLIMDFGYWESLTAAKISSWIVMLLGVLGAIWMGVWVC
jgi:succinate dehydrogenase / fumarate reductase, cytochrome b subunit